MSAYRKKLIEVDIPLAGIDEPSARLKQKAPKGYPTRLHKWWAQTPVPAARAVLFSQLVDDPSAWPERFPTEADQARERQRLHRIIVGNVDPKTGRWENGITDWGSAGVPRALEAARYEIARCIAWHRGEEPPQNSREILLYLQEHGPVVFDPFCGSGTIPQEAQRLGLRCVGSDLNPVAVLISKALVEIPPKFADCQPVNPESRERIQDGSWTGKGADGLAADVKYYGRLLHDRAKVRLDDLYPPVRLPGSAAEAPVVAWLWARTVESRNPAAQGAHVPLVSSFILSTRESNFAWVEVENDSSAPDGWRFVVRTGKPSEAELKKAKAGTVDRAKGGTCILTEAPMPFSYIREKGVSAGLGVRLMAIIADQGSGRIYLSPDAESERVSLSAVPTWEPEGELPYNPRNFNTPIYGLQHFKDLFTKRQLVALETFAELVAEIREEAVHDALHSGYALDDALAEGGSGAQAYGDAISLYLAMAISRYVQFGSTQTTWYTKDQAVKGLPQQALPMTWDYCEANPFAASSANFFRCAQNVADCVEAAPAFGYAIIEQRPAQTPLSIGAQHVLVSTDPPYYDNVAYADLADFFHIWLRRSLRKVFPSLTATLSTPKREELVASSYRDRDGVDPDDFWLDGMRTAMKGIYAASSIEPAAIYYAYKQREGGGEERVFSSSGWAAFLQSVYDTGFILDGTWALRVNNPGRKAAQGTNALASAVILACRKRPDDARVTTRAAFLRELQSELPTSIKLFQVGNIAPVDLAQAAIGPGMAIFSRYERVLKADDSAMTVREALQDINAALDTFLSEQEAEYDAYTRFAITWFEQAGMTAGAYGRAETLATARGISVGDVRDIGIVESGGGKVRLKRRDELANGGSRTNSTVWGSAQYLIYRLMEDSEEAAAETLSQLGHRAEAAKDLAHRLYRICEDKRWAEEGYAYNALGASWPRLVERAKSFATGPAQANLGI